MKLIKTKEEMIKYGKALATTLKGGDILCLEGELGAGKTTLAKGIALGLGAARIITSPTFALMNIYKIQNTHNTIPAFALRASARQSNIATCLPVGKVQQYNNIKLVHIDTYRLKNEQELIDIGAEDYLGAPDAICVIEWPEKIEGLLKNIRQRRIRLGRKKTIRLRIEHDVKGGRIIKKSNYPF